MSARDHRAETPEAVALALFMEIRHLEEKDEQARGENEPLRARLLDLYAECLITTRGDRLRPSDGALRH